MPAPAHIPIPGGSSSTSFAPPQKSKTGLYVGIGAAAAAVLLLAVVFGGGSSGGMLVTVSGPGGTAVEGVQVMVDGEIRCETSTCSIEDLEPGSYVVKAVADGYTELAGKAYEVEDGEQKAVNIELSPEAGTGIRIASKAPGLKVSVDGREVGPLPQDLSDLEPGEHTIEIGGSQFFKPFKEAITLRKGQTLDFEPKLELEKGKVAIKLDSTAKDAEVTLVVNGKRRSITPHVKKGSPIILPVEGKEYQLVASKRGYEDFEEDLEFSIEEPVKTVTIALSESSGDDEEEPSGRAATRVPSTTTSTTSSSTPSASTSRAVASGPGKLNVNSIPVSNVIVDGRPMGSTPKMNISVPAGNHTVVFVHPQHGRKVKTIRVKPGQTATAAVRFP